MPWDDRIGRRLKLKDLQILLAVIEAGGIGKAAGRLNYSQPAVSQAITGLERTFGRRLLERNRKGIELTPFGDALFRGGIAVFDDLRKAVADIDFLSDPTAGEIGIGCTEPVSAGIVSEVIDRLARQYPRIVFHLALREPTALYRELSARKVDFVISQKNHYVDEECMQFETLYSEPIVIVCGSAHSLARKRRIELEDLVDAPWVLPPSHSFIGSLLAEAFRARGLESPHTAVMTHSAYLRLVMVAKGHFLTAVPAVMVKLGIGHIPIMRLPVALPGNRTPVRIVTLKDRALSPVAQLFLRHARTLAKAIAKTG